MGAPGRPADRCRAGGRRAGPQAGEPRHRARACAPARLLSMSRSIRAAAWKRAARPAMPQPTFVEEGVIHYCVTNMPGAVARTSALALNNETLPFVAAIAVKGWRRALSDDPHLRDGLNICRGAVTHAAVATALGRPYVPAASSLENGQVSGARVLRPVRSWGFVRLPANSRRRARCGSCRPCRSMLSALRRRRIWTSTVRGST